ncbi:phage terminase small subunit [Perlucidibaca piscinae]|uniref:phage terminase small subunit n=1 Tax=Perlucidibaca piscinae TaxID=392589 RepID=UPI00058F7154|nr:phage terminase small subunit [Perlucidibaca piscinae]
MNRRLSPAQRHFIRVTASQTAAAAQDEHGEVTGSAYELMLAKLTQDRARLKAIQSVETKIAVKREILPEYADYVAGALVGGKGGQDEVLTRVMLWRIDIGDIAGALPLASYVLRYQLVLPDSFNRTMGCLIAEEIAEQALVAVAAGTPMALELLASTAELTTEQDMPDEARAKLEKAIGRTMLAQINPDAPASTDKTWLEQAIPHLHRALTLHDKCGVKTEIDRAERALKKIAEPAPLAPAG